MIFDPKNIRQDINDGNYQRVEVILGSVEENIDTLILRSELSHGLGEYNSAYKYAERVLSDYNEVNPSNSLISIHLMALAKFKLGNHKEAYNIALKGLRLIEKMETEILEQYNMEHGLIVKIIGVYYLESGNINEGMNYLNKSLELIRKTKDIPNLATIYNDIAYGYQINGELIRAEHDFNLALELLGEDQYPIQRAIILSNLGEIYRMRGELSIALEYHQEAYEIRLTLMNQQGLAIQSRYLGAVYYEMGNYTESEKHIDQSRTLWKSLDNPLWFSATLFDYCRIRIKLNQDIDEPLSTIYHLFEKSGNKIINNRYMLLKAMDLKRSPRIIQKAEAQRLLRKIFEGDMVDFELKYLALKEYLKLLFEEIKLSYHMEIVDEAIEISNLISRLGIDNKVYSKQIDTLIIQSYLFELKNDFKRAKAYLDQAELLIVEHNITELEDKITNAKNKLKSDKKKLSSKIHLHEIIETLGNFFT